MVLVRPRITEYNNIFIPQINLDFAIPLLDEDIPLFVDPFLLWKSPSYQDKSIHSSVLNSFNHLGWMTKNNKKNDEISYVKNL